LIECKLVHMFIHCNLWLVSLLNADSLSVSFFVWLNCDHFLLRETTIYTNRSNYLHRIWNYNCYKRTTDIYSIWISNICSLEISVAWPYPKQTAFRYILPVEPKHVSWAFPASPTSIKCMRIKEHHSFLRA